MFRRICSLIVAGVLGGAVALGVTLLFSVVCSPRKDPLPMLQSHNSRIIRDVTHFAAAAEEFDFNMSVLGVQGIAVLAGGLAAAVAVFAGTTRRGALIGMIGPVLIVVGLLYLELPHLRENRWLQAVGEAWFLMWALTLNVIAGGFAGMTGGFVGGRWRSSQVSASAAQTTVVETPPQPAGGLRRIMWPVVVTSILAVVAVVWWIQANSAQSQIHAQKKSVQKTNTSEQSASKKPASADAQPKFSTLSAPCRVELTTFAEFADALGVIHRRGKPVIVYLWSLHCPPSRAALNQIVALNERLNREADTISICVGSQSQTSRDGARKALVAAKACFENWFVDEVDWPDIQKAFGVNSTPALLLIDEAGKKVRVFTPDQDNWLAAAEKATREQARIAGASNPTEPTMVRQVKRDDLRTHSAAKGKAVVGMLPTENGNGSIVTAVPGTADRVWDGKTLGGFKDLIDGKKALDNEVLDRIGAFVREQMPNKEEDRNKKESELRARFIQAGDAIVPAKSIEAQVAQQARDDLQDYFQQAPPEEKQKLVDLYAERGAPIGQIWRPAEQEQVQWYQIPANGDVRQVVRSYTPPPRPVQQGVTIQTPPSTIPAPDVDLVGKIGAFGLIMNENVYDHRPGNDGIVASQQRVITVDNPPELKGQAKSGTSIPSLAGITSFTPGNMQVMPAGVNNIAAILKRKASTPRSPNAGSTVRPNSANASLLALLERQRLEQQKNLEALKQLQQDLKLQKEMERNKEIERQKELDRQKRELEQKKLELEKQQRQKEIEHLRKEIESEASNIKAEKARVHSWELDLNRRDLDLGVRIRAHNLERYDSTDTQAVQAYNARADQLNLELADLRAELRRLQDERQHLLQRTQHLDGREQKLRSLVNH